MQKVNTIEEYFRLFNDEQQRLLRNLHEIIKSAAPNAIEVISYNMPAFKQGKVLVYYAMNKSHIGFYPTSEPILHFKKELEQYSTSKGAIQFPLNKPLPASLIKKMVKFRLTQETLVTQSPKQ